MISLTHASWNHHLYSFLRSSFFVMQEAVGGLRRKLMGAGELVSNQTHRTLSRHICDISILNNVWLVLFPNTQGS